MMEQLRGASDVNCITDTLMFEAKTLLFDDAAATVPPKMEEMLAQNPEMRSIRELWSSAMLSPSVISDQFVASVHYVFGRQLDDLTLQMRSLGFGILKRFSDLSSPTSSIHDLLYAACTNVLSENIDTVASNHRTYAMALCVQLSAVSIIRIHYERLLTLCQNTVANKPHLTASLLSVIIASAERSQVRIPIFVPYFNDICRRAMECIYMETVYSTDNSLALLSAPLFSELLSRVGTFPEFFVCLIESLLHDALASDRRFEVLARLDAMPAVGMLYLNIVSRLSASAAPSPYLIDVWRTLHDTIDASAPSLAAIIASVACAGLATSNQEILEGSFSALVEIGKKFSSTPLVPIADTLLAAIKLVICRDDAYQLCQTALLARVLVPMTAKGYLGPRGMDDMASILCVLTMKLQLDYVSYLHVLIAITDFVRREPSRGETFIFMLNVDAGGVDLNARHILSSLHSEIFLSMDVSRFSQSINDTEQLFHAQIINIMKTIASRDADVEHLVSALGFVHRYFLMRTTKDKQMTIVINSQAQILAMANEEVVAPRARALLSLTTEILASAE